MRLTILLAALGMGMVASADDIACRARTPQGIQCLASVEAGAFTQCPGGYKRESVSAPGQVRGNYCVRTCTSNEQKDCDASGCQSYSDACAPGQPISCQLAVNYCNGVVSDYICSNAPNYRKCDVTNKCQPDHHQCCPEGEEKMLYLAQIVNIFENPENMTRALQVATCGTGVEADSKTIDKAYRAAGGRQFPGSFSAYCGGTTYYHYFLNNTKCNLSDMDLITQNSMQICESAGGTFSVKVNK